MHKLSIQRNKETIDLKNTIEQMNLTDIYRTFNPTISRIYILLKCMGNVSYRPYVRPQNKSQQIQEDRNYIRYLFWPQRYETRYQQEHERGKIHKYLEIKKHTPKQLLNWLNKEVIRLRWPEVYPRLYSQLIYDKGGRIYNREKTESSINNIGKTGQLHAKESNWTTFSCGIKI